MSYITISTLLGLIFFVTGFFTMKYPRTLSSYSQLEKKGVEEKLIVRYIGLVSKSMYVTGAVIILGGLVAYYADWSFGQPFILIIPPLVMILFVATQAPKISKVTMIASSTIIIMLTGVLFYVSREPEIVINERGIDITGIYGGFIPLNEISQIRMVNKLPAIKMRTNGLDMGYIKKGYFKLDSLGRTKLLLHSAHGPYLNIMLNDSSFLILNSSNPATTNLYFSDLQKYFQPRNITEF